MISKYKKTDSSKISITNDTYKHIYNISRYIYTKGSDLYTELFFDSSYYIYNN